MKKFILLAMLLSASVLVFAQDDGKMDEGYGPKAGEFTFSMVFGRANIMNSGLTLPSAPGSNTGWNVGNNTPSANNIDLQLNAVSNMVGLESRYFVSDKVAVVISGVARLDNTPGQVNLPGVIDPNAPNAAWIPSYSSIPANSSALLNFNIGGQYVFDTKVERLFPYVGLSIPLYYARQTQYDPAINDAAVAAAVGGGNAGTSGLVTDLGKRTGEVFGFGIQAVGGVDYYLLEGFYLGLEIRPASWIYAYSASKPGPGLELQQSNTNTFSFFTQPFMKVGFKF